MSSTSPAARQASVARGTRGTELSPPLTPTSPWTRGTLGLRQRWSTSCGPTLAQALRAAVDPAYAERLREPAFQASEQRRLLEQAGGAAVPLGEPGGRGADCLPLLNQAVAGKKLEFHPRYVLQADELGRAEWRTALLRSVLAATAAGYPVPLGIGPSDGHTEHYVLALESARVDGEPQLLLFNPADGSRSWRSLGWLADPRRGFTPTQTHLTVAYLPSHEP